MKKTITILAVLTLILASCSINVSPPATPSPAAGVYSEFVTSTPMPTESAATPLPYPTTTIPITWADLHLTGRLVYINAQQNQNSDPTLSINILDLGTGTITPIFQGPDMSWIYYMSVSPDGKQVLMSYSVPSPNHGPVNQNLYILPLDGSQPPQLLINPPTQYDQFVQEEWSPDGKYIYFVHYSYQNQSNNQHYPSYEIFRVAYPGGQPEKIADQAFWPRLSADGTRMVYISMDPNTGKNKIFIANADGTNAQPVVLSGAWTPDIIDAPIFSADGQSIIFSALSPQQSYTPSWVDRLFGVQIAEAHMIPSDWWSVPIAGGVVTRLTSLRTTALFASFSPDKRVIASYSGGGMFVMNPDGSNLTMLIPDMGGTAGTVSWIP
jgi:Tol biopolymer transport system component